MRLKNSILVAILSIATTSVLIPETTYAHGGSKKWCKNDAYGNPAGCKHKGWKKKRKNSNCHKHDFDTTDKRPWSSYTGIFGISGTDCKKT